MFLLFLFSYLFRCYCFLFVLSTITVANKDVQFKRKLLDLFKCLQGSGCLLSSVSECHCSHCIYCHSVTHCYTNASTCGKHIHLFVYFIQCSSKDPIRASFSTERFADDHEAMAYNQHLIDLHQTNAYIKSHVTTGTITIIMMNKLNYYIIVWNNMHYK